MIIRAMASVLKAWSFHIRIPCESEEKRQLFP